MSEINNPGAPETGAQNFTSFQTDPSLGQGPPFNPNMNQPNVPPINPNVGPIPQTPPNASPNIGAPNQFYRPQAPDIWTSLSKLAPSSELSQDGQDYVKAFIDTIKNDQFLVQNLQATYLNVPQKSILVTQGNNSGFLILFEETLNTAINDQITEYNIHANNYFRNIPISRIAITSAIKSLIQTNFDLSKIDKFNLLGIEIIRTQDYKRASRLADRIKSAFFLNAQVKDPFTSPIRYSDILTNSTVNIFTDIKDVKNSIEIVSPHATHPRVDFGCRIVINYPIQQNYGPSKASCEIGTIGGYAQFIEDTNTNLYTPQAIAPKYTPLIHITDISTVFPTPSLLAILVTTFYEVFCLNRGYQKAYYDLTLENNKRNIQYLFPPDAEGRVAPGLDTIEGRQAILNSPHFNLPMLVMDVTEGHYLINSIQTNDLVSINNLIKHHLISAFSPTIPYIYNDIFERNWEEYTGTLRNTSNDLIDSRNCSDFLSTIDAIKDYNRARGLLSLYINPQDKVNIIKSIYGDHFRTDTVTNVYKINLNWLIEIRNILRTMVVIDQNNMNLSDGAQILDLSSDINTYNQQYGNIANAFSPFQQNRSYYGNFNNYNYSPYIQPAQPPVQPTFGPQQFQSNL